MTNEEQIHRTSVKLLANPGVKIEHDDICEKLIQAGARPGKDAQIIRIPEELIRESIDQAPESILLGDRTETGGSQTSSDRTLVWSVPGMNVLRDGQHREFTAADMADTAALMEALPEVDGVFGMAMADVPPNARGVVGLRIMAENTRKHIRVLSFCPEGCDAICEMKDVVDVPAWFSMGFTAHGPLRWTHLALEIYRRTAGRGIPVTINGEPMAGVSGPVTLAGSAAVGNAEILAGIVVNQILEPGRPCIYNLGVAHIFDMKTSIAVTGAPENHLLADIAARMGRYYNLPSCSWVSSESMCADSQAALEKTMGYVTHQQNGISLIWGVGQLESEMTLSFAQAVIDNEILAYTRRFFRGVEVNPETLAADVTREVGIAGDFLSHTHTFEHFRDEFYEPGILFRKKRTAWTDEGERDLAAVAEEHARSILSADREPVLNTDQLRALTEIEQRFLKTI